MTRQELEARARELVRAERQLAWADQAAWAAVEDERAGQRWRYGPRLERRIDPILEAAWAVDRLEGGYDHAVAWFREARPSARHWLHELVRRVSAERARARTDGAELT